MENSIFAKNLAFEEAVQALCRRYPPRTVPRTYLTGTSYPVWVTMHEEDVQLNMRHDAHFGRIGEVRRRCYLSGIPPGELDTVILLIYGEMREEWTR
jgi:hypothetical protein